MHTEQAVHYFNLKDAVEDFNDDVREQNALVMRGNCTRIYLSRDLEKLTTPTRQCT